MFYSLLLRGSRCNRLESPANRRNEKLDLHGAGWHPFHHLSRGNRRSVFVAREEGRPAVRGREAPWTADDVWLPGGYGPRVKSSWRAGLVLALVLVAAPAARAACEVPRAGKAYTARVDHALRAGSDLWGAELLRAPGGPTFERRKPLPRAAPLRADEQGAASHRLRRLLPAVRPALGPARRGFSRAARRRRKRDRLRARRRARRSRSASAASVTAPASRG